MKTPLHHLITLIALITPYLSISQTTDQYPVSIQASIYNPTNHTLNLIITPKDHLGNLNQLQLVELPPNDTTAVPLEIRLKEDQTPQWQVNYSIAEDKSYYEVDQHSNWQCERVEGTEHGYRCLYTISNYINIDTTIVFDREAYKRQHQKGGKIYDFTEEPAVYIDGPEGMMKHFKTAFSDLGLKEDLKIYCQIIIEKDSTISEVSVLKSYNPEHEDFTVKLLQDMQFIPGKVEGHAVRCRMTIPVVLRAE